MMSNSEFILRTYQQGLVIRPIFCVQGVTDILGDVREPSIMRKERTNYNVEMVQRRFGQSTPNFQQVFHSFFDDDVQESFESGFEVFNMDDHM